MTGGSYESKLLRLLVGYFHVTLMHQMALTIYTKPLHSLNQEEFDLLEGQVAAAVGRIANSLTEEFLSGDLKPPPTVN